MLSYAQWKHPFVFPLHGISFKDNSRSCFHFVCNESLIIFIFDPFPIILHPHPHFPKTLTAHGHFFLMEGAFKLPN